MIGVFFQLDSDQDSTDSEDATDDAVDMCPRPPNSMASLTPDMLLYSAARVHNLPVMIHALSMGANTNWVNEDEVHVLFQLKLN